MANKNRKPFNAQVWREVAGDVDFERAMFLNNRYHTRLRKLETKPKSTKDLSYLLVS